jgi:3'-phosphoadenosine 5'-phosphosulfate sulfotransferase (PAPS reductase)/FAD synthetase
MKEKKYTAEDLKTMQHWSLERKIQVTQTRIMEWYNYYEGRVYVSFSGGKDSTVLLDLVRRIYPEVEGVFIDTGLEYPELRNFVKDIKNIKWVKPEMNFKQVIDTYGYPIISKEVADNIYRARRGSSNAIDRMNGLNPDGTKSSFKKGNIKYKYLLVAPFKISNKCCNVMKKIPVKKYEKETGNHPIIGTMACESTFRKTGWLQVGCNAFKKDRPTSQPMSFWTENDVLEYISRFNIKYASVYGEIIKTDNLYSNTGCERTGCVFCGFGCHLDKEPNRFQKLKETHPKLWDFCMKSKEIGGLGMKEVLEYINVKSE